MAFLKRGTAISDVEKERDQLLTRKKALAAQKATAEAALQRAVADRQNTMIEADMDSGRAQEARALTVRLRDEYETVVDVLAAVDQKLADAEARLAAERDKAERDAERERREKQLERVRAAAKDFSTVAEMLLDKLAPLRGVGVMCSAAHVNLTYLAGELAKGFDCAFSEVQSYINQLEGGDVAIRTEAAPVAPPAPQPKVERKQIFLRHPGRWQENGETTAGRHVTCSPPIAIALAA
jgi:hypothetical protein